MPEERIYRPVPNFTDEEINIAILKDDVDSLIFIAFAVGYHGKDWKYAQDICIRLSDHHNKTVRGNAMLGLSYVALFQGELDKRLVKPILIRALHDFEDEVRERAQDAVLQINRLTKWRIADYQKSGKEKNTKDE